MKLPQSFYQRSDVVRVAKDLIGKILVTSVNEMLTSGIIVETEAYSYKERGCHAYKGQTERNKVMFEKGGISYVYLCYGMHHLFNVVTNQTGKADAVLIRALEPLQGMDAMMERMKVNSIKRITSGPGKLTKALGITKRWNGVDLMGDQVWIEEGEKVASSTIKADARIGIDYAGEDALLPWRFSIKDNKWVSK
ncbi:MAG: DNA-3-methyladenine glycosylase [Cyclobacteriaceae bacterium]|jgi:DNA-3-methyladenine glycosylase|nr:DNA-3-methyladenine glycosylase [Flammeovirgaceae bacterium]